MNKVQNIISGEYGKVPDVARAYKASGEGWVVRTSTHMSFTTDVCVR